MRDPIEIHHRIEFSTVVLDGDAEFHREIANEVVEELRVLGPLLIEARVLKARLAHLEEAIGKLQQK